MKLSGPLFLQVNKNGAIIQEQAIVSTSFLLLVCSEHLRELQSSAALSRMLTHDLQALNYGSWALYGTHSFRRGGCQYRVAVKRWSVDMVAKWGGWSQIEAQTMFRYFYSPRDKRDGMLYYDNNDTKRRRTWLF
jgi:hypothetical protein